MSVYDMDAVRSYVVREVEKGCPEELQAYAQCFDSASAMAQGGDAAVGGNGEASLARGREACAEEQARLSACSSRLRAVQDIAGRCSSFVRTFSQCYREEADPRRCAEHIRKLEECVRHAE